MVHRCLDVPCLKISAVCNYCMDVREAHILPGFSTGVVEDTVGTWLEFYYLLSV